MHLNDRIRPIEYRDRSKAFFFHAIDITHHFGQEPVRGLANLVRGSIIDLECVGPSAHLYAELVPRERLLENPLTKVASKEQSVCTCWRNGREQPQLGHAQVLSLVHHDMRERLAVSLRVVSRRLREDLRRGVETARADGLAHRGKDMPEPRPLRCAHAVFASEAWHIRVCLIAVDLPRVHNIGPFGNEEPERKLCYALLFSDFGKRRPDQFLRCSVRFAAKCQLIKLLRDTVKMGYHDAGN